MSSVYDCAEPDSRRAGLDAAIASLRSGRLVVLPTDTVYGIGVDAFSAAAVRSLLEAKDRGRDMPVPVLVGSWDTVEGLVPSVPEHARALIQAFWPGGLSIVLRAAASVAWDLGETRGTVMLRMPLHPVALELLAAVGPMAVSSANRSGRAPAATVDEAREQLGDQVSVYLDGGPCGQPVPSTVVDLTGADPVVLRQGAISAAEVGHVLGFAVEHVG